MAKIFKARLTDCGRPMRDVANKTRIATFAGTAFTAEREGEDLVIYMLSDEPVSTAASVRDRRKASDCRGMSAERLQASILKHREVRNDQ